MKAKRAPAAPDLSADTVSILLGGWGTNPPAGVDRGPHGFSGGLLECFGIGGPARLWRLHEAHLRAVAAVWGFRPRCRGADGVLRFAAEAEAWEEDHGVPAHRHGELAMHTDERDDAEDGAE